MVPVATFVDSRKVCQKCAWKRCSNELRRYARERTLQRQEATLIFKTAGAIPTVEKILSGTFAEDEIKFHKRAASLRSPHILPVLNVSIRGERLSLCLPYIMPLRFHECCSRYRMKTYIQQLVTGLKDLHSIGIVHGDVKPENVLMSKRTGKVLIIDFGLASEAGHVTQLISRDRNVRGTPRAGRGTAGYRAPEVLANVTGQHCASDMWSVGIVLMCLITKRLPPTMNRAAEANNMCKLIGTNVWTKLVADTPWSRVEVDKFDTPSTGTDWRRLCRGCGGSQALSLLGQLLKANPNDRLTAEQCLMHPFLAIAE